MTNIYNKSLFERNGIQDVPAGFIDATANDLFRFMGSFWKNLHRNVGFLNGVQKVRGIRLAQFYLDLLETLKLQDRKGLPVFHRELWKPLIIRKSQRNTAQDNIVKIDGEAVVGEQPSGSKYGEGTVLQIGSLADLDKYVTYPIAGAIETVGTSITDNVVNPSVSYSVEQEFPGSTGSVVFKNGTLIFPLDKDPFAEDSPFDIYDVPGTVGDTAQGDQETVLWASDVLIDRKYVSDHMAYALGIDCPSSDIAKRILNAGWDALNCSLTPELFRTLLAALVNVPVIQESTETVRDIRLSTDGTQTVVTDAHTYTVYKHAVLRSHVHIGSVLNRGDFLDETLKVYPLLTDTDARHLSELTEYADILKTDVPVITVPRQLLRAVTVNGISVDWNPTDVREKPGKDANGHRRLYFDLGGSPEDVQAFWEDTWAYAERHNIDLEEYFEDCAEDGSSSDPSWRIVPAKFFLEHMLGANTLIVTLDREQAEDTSFLLNPMFYDILRGSIPSGMRLFFVEHLTIDEDTVDMGDPEDVDDTVDKFVLDEIDDELEYNNVPGMRGKHIPTYEDYVEIKMFRNRKRTAKGDR